MWIQEVESQVKWIQEIGSQWEESLTVGILIWKRFSEDWTELTFHDIYFYDLWDVPYFQSWGHNRNIDTLKILQQVQLDHSVPLHNYGVVQCSRCEPVGDNVTWPRITLKKQQHNAKYTQVFVTILPRHNIDASGNILTRIHVYFVTLQIIHWFMLL